MNKSHVLPSVVVEGDVISIETDNSDDVRGIVLEKTVEDDRIYLELYNHWDDEQYDKMDGETLIVSSLRGSDDSSDISVWTSVEVGNPLTSELYKLYSGTAIYRLDISGAELLYSEQ